MGSINVINLDTVAALAACVALAMVIRRDAGVSLCCSGMSILCSIASRIRRGIRNTDDRSE
jgi:hypothetical protein